MSANGSVRSSLKSDPLWRATKLLGVSPKSVVIAVLAGSAALGSAVGLAAVSAWLIARASQMPPVLFLSVAVVSVRALGISRALFRYLERLASHKVALGGMVNLREQIYLRLSHGSIGAVVGLRRGDLLARVGADVDAVGDVVVRSYIPAAVAVVVSLLSVGIVGFSLPSAGLVLALCLVLAGVVAPMLAVRASRVAEDQASAARSSIAATSLALLDGAGELTVTGRVGSMLDGMQNAEASLRAAKDAAARPAALGAFIGNIAIGISVVASLLLGIPAVTAGTLDPVLLAVIVLTPLAAFESTNVLPTAAVQMQTSRAAARRIMSLLDAAAEPGSESDPASEDISAESSTEGTPLASARGLGVGWPGRGTVLAGVDLEVPAGRSIAVVGPSGCGKTTLMLTLSGLIAPTAGTLEATRKTAFTAEDAHVFNTSIIENLRVARGDITPDEALTALRRAGLGEWLRGLPHGLDTMIGPDAATVSGGERRRLLLARSLLTGAELLLVDEPGEHLDPDAADSMIADLLALGHAASEHASDHVDSDRVDSGNAVRAVVIVTHRVSGLAGADEILLLGESHDPNESSRVLARGSHQDLLASEPAYRELWHREQALDSALKET